MAREPHYPDDASLGSGKPAEDKAPAAAASPLTGAGDKAPDAKRNKHIVAGAAIGIGSAAIVAALLYANRRNRNDRGGNG